MAAPEATGDRLFVVTDDDRRGSLLVVSIICCAYVLLLMALRAVARRANFGADDYLATAATCTGMIHFALTFLAISNNLGPNITELEPHQAYRLGRAYLASDAFMFLTLFLTKCAVIVLCRRLFSTNMKQHRIICDATIGLATLWCCGSILGAVVKCDSVDRIGFLGQYCSKMMLRWKCIGIIDAITEMSIVCLALVVVFPLQMSVSKKIAVIFSFLPRLFLILLISLHLNALAAGHASTSTPGDRSTWSHKLSNVTIYREVQIMYAVFTAALPAINRLLRKFETSMGQYSSGDGSYGYTQNGTNTSSRTYGISVNRQRGTNSPIVGVGNSGRKRQQGGMVMGMGRQESHALHDMDHYGGRTSMAVGKEITVASYPASVSLPPGYDGHSHGNNPYGKTKMFSRTGFRPEPSHYVASAQGPGALGRSPLRERAFDELEFVGTESRLGGGRGGEKILDGFGVTGGERERDRDGNGGGHKRGMDEGGSDGGESVDSQAKIIRKDVSWQVVEDVR